MGPLRAFPFPLHIGTDICQISRIYQLLASHRGPRFLQRVLTQDERADIPANTVDVNGRLPTAKARITQADGDFQESKKRNPALWAQATFVAGRFAAKEAAYKAHPFRRLSFHDIVIVRGKPKEAQEMSNNGSGPPVAIIRAEREGEQDQTAIISISHDGDYVTAVCLGFDPSSSP